ncbi:hypothetical protein RRK08_002148 [Staphylococcus pseudintermedius]|nr:hypothetical protein [Staphylococcus pseudintermedius]
MFTNTEGTTSPAVVLGANRSGSVDPKRGDFAYIFKRSNILSNRIFYEETDTKIGG